MDDRSAVAAGSEAVGGGVPWTTGDIAKALIFPGVLFLISLIAVLAGSAEADEDYTSTELMIIFGFGIAFELFLLFMTWWFTIRKYGAAWSELGLRMPSRAGWWMPFALLGGSLAIGAVYSVFLDALDVDVDGGLPDGVFDSAGPAVLVVITALVMAPVVEELFFRGFIFGGLRPRLGAPTALAASGVIFGLMHLGNPGDIYIVPPIAAIGALFAWGYLYTGSLMPTMITHFLFNLSSLLLQAAST